MIYTIVKIKVEDRIIMYQTDGKVVHVLHLATDNKEMSTFRNEHDDLLSEFKKIGKMLIPRFKREGDSFDLNKALDDLVEALVKRELPPISDELLKLMYKPRKLKEDE